jgi:pimeloyl-ACP methyl ester carboxylesterase
MITKHLLRWVWVWVWVGLSLVLVGSISFLLYYLSGLLIFGGRIPSHFYRPLEPVCNEWYDAEVFADKRSEEEKAKSPVRLRTCAESLTLPKDTLLLTTQEGIKVRLVVPDSLDTGADLPIWLHIHGITDSYLNGMRFYDAAHRLGFKLMMLELQNHGGSDRHPQGASWGCRERWDLIATMDYINNRYPSSEVLITATSMGTLTVTEAILTQPESFDKVRGLIYESPISSFDNVLERICFKWSQRDFCKSLWHGLIFGLSHWRTDVDLASCHQPDMLKTGIPTMLWLSEEEYPTAAIRELSQQLPRHTQVRTTVYPRGSHSAYYGSQPERTEEDIREFWMSVPRTLSSEPKHAKP